MYTYDIRAFCASIPRRVPTLVVDSLDPLASRVLGAGALRSAWMERGVMDLRLSAWPPALSSSPYAAVDQVVTVSMSRHIIKPVTSAPCSCFQPSPAKHGVAELKPWEGQGANKGARRGQCKGQGFCGGNAAMVDAEQSKARPGDTDPTRATPKQAMPETGRGAEREGPASAQGAERSGARQSRIPMGYGNN